MSCRLAGDIQGDIGLAGSGEGWRLMGFSSHVQAQLECNASNAKIRGSCCEGWVDWARRIVGS